MAQAYYDNFVTAAYRSSHRGFRRRLILSLLIAVIIASLLFVYYGSVSANNCLRYQVGRQYDRLLNVYNGSSQTVPYLEPVNTATNSGSAVQESSSTVSLWKVPSPDGKYIAYLEPTPYWTDITGYIATADHPSGNKGDAGQVVCLLAERCPATASDRARYTIYSLAWGTDEAQNQFALFTWANFSDPRQLFITKLSPDGKNRNTWLLLKIPRFSDNYMAYMNQLGTGSTYVLSPDGVYLTTWQNPSPKDSARPVLRVLSVAALLSNAEPSLTQPLLSEAIQPNGFIRWSPNSRALVQLTPTLDRSSGRTPKVQMTVFNVEGVPIMEAQELPSEPNLYVPEVILPARWSADGQSLYFLRSTSPSGSYTEPRAILDGDLVRFDVASKRLETVVANVKRRPFYSFENMWFYAYDSPQTERAVIVRQNDIKIAIDMLDTNGQNRLKLVEGADGVGDPLWMRDGKTVLYTWFQGWDGTRRGGLGWMHIGETSPHTLDGSFTLINSLTLLNDDQSVAYIRQSGNDYSIDILNVKTGITKHVADGFVEVTDLQRKGTSQLTFWWRTAGDRAGIGVYDLERDQTYLYKSQALPGTYLNTSGGIYSSADGKAAVLVKYPKTRQNTPASWHTELLFVDGEPIVLTDKGANYTAEVLMSPDQQRVAVQYTVLESPSRLLQRIDVYTLQGTFLQRFDRSGGYPNLRWSQCRAS